MSLIETEINKEFEWLTNYNDPQLVTVMGWNVAIHTNSIRLYDPLGRLSAEIYEGEFPLYHKCQPEHLELFLKAAHVKLTP